MPFGVDLSNAEFKNPTDQEQGIGAGNTSGSGDAAPSGEAFKTESPSGERASSVTDIAQEDKAPRKDYTKEELEKFLGIETEAQPTQDFKKFEDNFGYDLATLLKDPSQFQKFTTIYPPQYVEKAKQVLLNNGINPYATNESPKALDPLLDPRIQKVLERIERFEVQEKEQRIESINSKLDSTFDKLSTKYPDADKNVINFYLQGLVQKKISLMDEKGNLRTQIIEKLFKQDHDARNKIYEEKYRAKVEAQKKMNLKSKDMGSGGSIGSVQGQQARTMKEATKALLNDIRNSK